MDTEIFYKYKDKYHSDIKSGEITLDKSVYKQYLSVYDCKFEDSIITSLPRRLWNVDIICRGDNKCREFLNDLKVFWTADSNKKGFAEQYEEKFKDLYEFLLNQEIIEIEFAMY